MINNYYEEPGGAKIKNCTINLLLTIQTYISRPKIEASIREPDGKQLWPKMKKVPPKKQKVAKTTKVRAPVRVVERKKLIIIIAAVLLLCHRGCSRSLFHGLLDPIIGSNDTEDAEPEEEEDPEAADCGGVAYYDLQELMINLNTAGAAKSSILKILVSFGN